MTTELPRSVDTTDPPMADTEAQTGAGNVLWHFTMSLTSHRTEGAAQPARGAVRPAASARNR